MFSIWINDWSRYGSVLKNLQESATQLVAEYLFFNKKLGLYLKRFPKWFKAQKRALIPAFKINTYCKGAAGHNAGLIVTGKPFQI